MRNAVWREPRRRCAVRDPPRMADRDAEAGAFSLRLRADGQGALAVGRRCGQYGGWRWTLPASRNQGVRPLPPTVLCRIGAGPDPEGDTKPSISDVTEECPVRGSRWCRSPNRSFAASSRTSGFGPDGLDRRAVWRAAWWGRRSSMRQRSVPSWASGSPVVADASLFRCRTWSPAPPANAQRSGPFLRCQHGPGSTCARCHVGRRCRRSTAPIG